MLVLAVVIIFPFSVLRAYSQATPLENSAVQPNNLPQAKLLYNNQNYDMSPFVFVDSRTLNKVHFPSDGEDSQNILNVKQGDTVSFQFSEKPIKVDAFIIDYEAQPSELYALKKLSPTTFELKGPEGTQNLEAQVFFPGGRYASYDMVAYVLPASSSSSSSSSSPQNLNQSTQFATIQGNSTNSLDSQTFIPQICGRQNELSVIGITSSIQNSLNSIPANVLDSNLGTIWSPKGIDVFSFVKSILKNTASSISKNPWLQLDLGTQNLLCTVGIAFDNADNTVNSFTIQTSTDGVHFKDVGSAQSTPISPAGLLYKFSDLPDSARFVRITNVGSLTTASPGIAEMIAAGEK